MTYGWRRTPELYPSTTATNAYELLDDIKATILAEPRRMRMADFFTNPAWLSAESVPACGTIGCIAGHVLYKTHNSTLDRWYGRTPGEVAARILGFHSSYDVAIQELFYNGALVSDVCQGTPEHAAAVARLITAFQEKHEARLRATSVVIS